MNNLKRLFATGCVVLLASCGGGGGSSVTVNGVFADALVEGLPYECGSTTAVTGTGGTFACPQNSTVIFSVGGIHVCAQTVQEFITPLSCAQATDPTANTSSPAVVKVVQFLLSISTTPASSGALTITADELTAAAGLTLHFSTADDNALQAAVTAIDGAILVDAATAEDELTGVIFTTFAGDYSGTWTTTFGDTGSGTWSITIASDGSVSGTASGGDGGIDQIVGSLVSGSTFSGTAGGSDWTGTLDTSQTPAVFSGTWAGQGRAGNFHGG